MYKRALLIVNLHSKNGAMAIDAAVEKLKNADIEVIKFEVASPQKIPKLIHRYRDQVELVIMGGGDGTVHAAAEALVETKLPLAIFPMGTANDLARTLEIPIELTSAVDVITEGILHPIDLGRVNGHYFFNIANIGLGVTVKKNLSRESKQSWGVLSYTRGLIKAVKSFRPFKAEIRCDQRRHRVASIQIAIGNGRYYGGGMMVNDKARIDDGCLCLYSLKPVSLWTFLKYALAFRKGQFKEHHPVDLDFGKEIEITTSKPMVVTADGEFATRTPAKFMVCPGAIRVFVPVSYVHSNLEPQYAYS